jgi:glycosyltransferase involved in cell wall biosynthesis
MNPASKRPRFSIVVPAFDAARTVAAAIRSAQLQTVESLEILVVDDGSGDCTSEIVESLGREDTRVRLFRQPRSGPSSARNHALRHARGELVTFLDADDLLLPEYLDRMGAALDGAPQAGLAFTDAWLLDDATGRVQRAGVMSYRKPKAQPEDPRDFLHLLLRRNFVFVATTVRRRALEAVGGWRESLTAAEDYELWLRLVAAGYPAVHVDGRLAVYRRSLGSNSRDIHRLLASARDVYREVAETWDVDEASAKIAARRALQVERWIGRYDAGRDWPSTRLAVSRIRAGLREPRRWLDEPPAAVRSLLARTAHPLPHDEAREPVV